MDMDDDAIMSTKQSDGSTTPLTSNIQETTPTNDAATGEGARIYDERIANYESDIFPYRNRFMLKIYCFLVAQNVLLVLIFTLPWFRWQSRVREVNEKNPMDIDHFVSRFLPIQCEENVTRSWCIIFMLLYN